ncbi:hypothetical protein [Flavobacterium sp.]|uniref:hypothetical protein n=1 Tax=Flavobacterium sp. TaxID=239 RepID=UPI003D0C52A9
MNHQIKGLIFATKPFMSLNTFAQLKTNPKFAKRFYLGNELKASYVANAGRACKIS